MFKSISKSLTRNLRYFSQQKQSNDTIYALSSGINTAISIIRISGDNSKNVLKMLNNSKACKILQNPRVMHFSRIFNINRQIIDEAMIVYFPKNMSYNQQQIFELHLHGSKAVVDAVFKQLKTMNMRMAQRGQITKRAVINGKISLNQAQAINDLINSQNQFSRQISINNLLGKNINYVEQIKEDLVKCLAKSQAYIDFNEDESDVKQTLFDDTKIWVKQNLLNKIKSLLRNYKNLKLLKDGIDLVIMGKPNVGKSTLINLLANKKVSIVNSKAGTTRDIIQTSIQLQGFRLNLIDTAGLRQSECEIQNQGVNRAKQKIKESHIKLLMIDLHQQKMQINQAQKVIIVNLSKEDQCIRSVFQNEDSIILVNKIDLLQEIYKDFKILIQMDDNKTIRTANVKISALKQNLNPQNLIFEKLSQKLKQEFSFFLNPNQIYFTRQRYFMHLQRCLQKLELYIQEDQVDFACQYLRQSINQVKEIFGRVDCQDVLDVLFRDFCIGK